MYPSKQVTNKEIAFNIVIEMEKHLLPHMDGHEIGGIYESMLAFIQNELAKPKNWIEYKTLLVDTTTPEDNLTDLANAYAHFGFVAKMSEHDLVENIKHVIAEQYTQSILQAVDKK